MGEIFTTQQVMAVTGASRRQLAYWADRGLIRGLERTGRGYPLRWTAEQVEIVRALKVRMDAVHLLTLPSPDREAPAMSA